MVKYLIFILFSIEMGNIPYERVKQLHVTDIENILRLLYCLNYIDS